MSRASIYWAVTIPRASKPRDWGVIIVVSLWNLTVISAVLLRLEKFKPESRGFETCGETPVYLVNWFSLMLDSSDSLWASSHSAGAGYLRIVSMLVEHNLFPFDSKWLPRARVHSKLNKKYLSMVQDSSGLGEISSWFMLYPIANLHSCECTFCISSYKASYIYTGILYMYENHWYIQTFHWLYMGARVVQIPNNSGPIVCLR